MKKDFVLKSKKDDILRVSSFVQNDDDFKPCIIYVHGFKGFKDWGFVPYLADYFSDRGFFVVTFNFSHNGVGESLTDFDELDKFEKNTISLEVEELNEIIDFIAQKTKRKIGIIGHSRGGGVSVLAASKNNSVNAVAVWASVSKLDRYSQKQKAFWKKDGFLEVLNTRTNQMMKLSLDLLEDIENNTIEPLNIEKAIKKLKKPLFVVHGNQDESVPFSESKDLYRWANKELTSFLEVPEAGHTFDIVHPFSGSNPKFELVLEKTNSFFNKYL